VGIAHFTTVPTATYLVVMKNASVSERRLIARDVRPDSRKRVALGRALDHLEDASFNVYRDEAGRIILDPQVSIPASEAWLFRNRKALDSVRRGLEEAAEGKAASAGSFAKFADDGE
jgi:hypothetical protein